MQQANLMDLEKSERKGQPKEKMWKTVSNCNIEKVFTFFCFVNTIMKDKSLTIPCFLDSCLPYQTLDEKWVPKGILFSQFLSTTFINAIIFKILQICFIGNNSILDIAIHKQAWSSSIEMYWIYYIACDNILLVVVKGYPMNTRLL